MNKKIISIKRKFNLAIVGLGRISTNHLKAMIYNNDKCNIAAICDVDKEKLKKANEEIISGMMNKSELKYPMEYNEYKELINDIKNKRIEIDLIILTTPSGLHAEQTILAANEKVNVCTEKPIATKWVDGQRMVEICKKNKVKLFVVKQNRYNKTLQLTKKQIENNNFGKIILVTVNVFWHRPQSYYDQAKWRGTSEMDGGALMNQASHYVDLLHWLIGPLETINAFAETRCRDIETEDTATLNIRWKSGAIGTMAVTMLTYPKNIEGSITILGENGSVKVGGSAVNEIEFWKFANNEINNLNYKQTSSKIKNVYGSGHIKYYENMLLSLEDKEAEICDGIEGLKTLEILTAAYRSAEYGNTIRFPLEKLYN